MTRRRRVRRRQGPAAVGACRTVVAGSATLPPGAAVQANPVASVARHRRWYHRGAVVAERPTPAPGANHGALLTRDRPRDRRQVDEGRAGRGGGPSGRRLRARPGQVDSGRFRGEGLTAPGVDSRLQAWNPGADRDGAGLRNRLIGPLHRPPERNSAALCSKYRRGPSAPSGAMHSGL